ncbi:TatD family hydrolase [Aestuariirhabdus sp. Z084]|uniref:TatD family hydrolase n=1 Tax=Aestuariirhabdus haliotis TaxID=2918751 RepID=UPI00201B39DF|nr:TatD family hydrolase [Aestuariirhabdus haliotis]MCL6415186.1 TatD family hydrolase [Aestuariirhabdus haliotis]MCL6420061.1 TatD family hydrolase [Aestuariirhabdus haliotis]
MRQIVAHQASMFFDTHCHLDFPQFDDGRSRLLDDCAAARVDKILIPGVSASSWAGLMSLCAKNDSRVQLMAAVGLHPFYLDQHQVVDLVRLSQLLQQRPEYLVAVGEIGLDYMLPEHGWPMQHHLFRQQLKIAKSEQLPVLLHVRKAHDQVLKCLRELDFDCGGVVHAFSGSEQQARRYIERGFLLGVGGAISWSRATRLRSMIARLPIESLVLETDAPDMMPAFAEGEWNSPLNLPAIAECLAELKKVSVLQIADQSLRNILKLLYAEK